MEMSRDQFVWGMLGQDLVSQLLVLPYKLAKRIARGARVVEGNCFEV